MTDILADAWYGLEHGKRRLAEFDAVVAAYVADNPYALVTELDLDRQEEVLKVKLVKPIPPALNGIAFDVVSNLRAALDRCGYAVALPAGSRVHNAAFPFGDTFTDANSRRKHRSRDIPVDIFDLMISHKPYKGGNDFLWLLNKLCNANKHAIVVPTAFVADSNRLNRFEVTGATRWFNFPLSWDRLKNEMVVCSAPPRGTHLNYDFGLEISVVLETPDGDDRPALYVFRRIVESVEAVLVDVAAHLVDRHQASGRGGSPA